MGQLSITTIDVLVVVVILVSTGFAAFRGLVHETFAILEWVAGIYVALRLTPVVQPLLNGAISPRWLEWTVLFVGTFLFVFVPLSIMSHRLSEKVKKSEIGPLDRVLGLVFGVARGLVIVGLAYLAFGALVPTENQPNALTNARVYPLLQTAGDLLLSLAPGEARRLGLTGSADERAQAPKAGSENSQAAPGTTTYGANDRGALDRLFQTNEGSGSSSK